MTINEVCTILEDYAIDDVHEILLRNDLFLPTKGSHWATKKVMLSMFKGEIYCPKFSDLRPRPCPRPPT